MLLWVMPRLVRRVRLTAAALVVSQTRLRRVDGRFSGVWGCDQGVCLRMVGLGV